MINLEVYLITILSVFTFSNLSYYFGTKNINVIVKNRFFILLTGTCLILVAGLRWNVGTDYWQYTVNYDNYVEQVWSDFFSYNDPGIKLISWLSSYLYDDYATMFFISSLITIGLFVLTISKHSKMFVYSMLLYIFVGTWHGSFNGVKQFLACAILFAGHRYILNRNFLKYLSIVFIAGMFHISSWGMILLYLVPRKRLKVQHLAIMILISIAIIFSYDYLFELIENLRGDSFAMASYVLREVNLLRVLVAFAPLLIYFTLTNKEKLTNEDFFYINLLFINAVVNFATSQSAYLARFAIFTSVFTILGLPRLLNIEDKKLLFLIQMVTIVLYSLFWYVDIVKSSSLVDFEWIFERD